MPTYQYTCTDCGEPVEAVQKFSDDPLTICAACGGRLRKVFSPVGIVFKGSGFYRTDSRNGSVSASGADRDKKDKQPGESKPAADANGSLHPAQLRLSRPARVICVSAEGSNGSPAKCNVNGASVAPPTESVDASDRVFLLCEGTAPLKCSAKVM